VCDRITPHHAWRGAPPQEAAALELHIEDQGTLAAELRELDERIETLGASAAAVGPLQAEVQQVRSPRVGGGA
jgi:hypothetical protein